MVSLAHCILAVSLCAQAAFGLPVDNDDDYYQSVLDQISPPISPASSRTLGRSFGRRSEPPAIMNFETYRRVALGSPENTPRQLARSSTWSTTSDQPLLGQRGASPGHSRSSSLSGVSDPPYSRPSTPFGLHRIPEASASTSTQAKERRLMKPHDRPSERHLPPSPSQRDTSNDLSPAENIEIVLPREEQRYPHIDYVGVSRTTAQADSRHRGRPFFEIEELGQAREVSLPPRPERSRWRRFMCTVNCAVPNMDATLE